MELSPVLYTLLIRILFLSEVKTACLCEIVKVSIYSAQFILSTSRVIDSSHTSFKNSFVNKSLPESNKSVSCISFLHRFDCFSVIGIRNSSFLTLVFQEFHLKSVP